MYRLYYGVMSDEMWMGMRWNETTQEYVWAKTGMNVSEGLLQIWPTGR